MKWLVMIKEITILIASTIGAIVAIVGLNTWKAQQRGKIAFNLSRRLLANTYRLRDQVYHLRSPYMASSEMEEPPEDSPYSGSEEGRHFYHQYSGYKKRLEHLVRTKEKLYVDLVEAEALWDSNIRGKYNNLFALIKQLEVEINVFLANLNPENRFYRRTNLSEEREERRMRIMYGTTDDEYSQNINDAITDIETVVRPHLKNQQ